MATVLNDDGISLPDAYTCEQQLQIMVLASISQSSKQFYSKDIFLAFVLICFFPCKPLHLFRRAYSKLSTPLPPAGEKTNLHLTKAVQGANGLIILS